MKAAVHSSLLCMILSLAVLFLTAGCRFNGNHGTADFPLLTPSYPAARGISHQPDSITPENSREGTMVKMNSAAPSDFSVPLYPSAKMLTSRRAKGISPLDRPMNQASMEIYTADAIDSVVLYYQNMKGLYKMKDIRTEEGRKVVFCDGPDLVSLPGPCRRRGTTVVVMEYHGRTDITYSSFSEDGN